MIEKEKSLLQTEEIEKVSKKPLSDEEISSLIKASNNNKFNEVELKVKKIENQSFKKITLHDIAKQINQQNKEKIIKQDKKSNLNQSKSSEDKKENIEEKKHDNINNEIIKNKENNEDVNKESNASTNNENIKTEDKKIIDEDQHLKLLEEEKKVAYEKGKTDALNEVKEGSDAAIAQLKKVIDSISRVEELDLRSFEKNIEEKVIEQIRQRARVGKNKYGVTMERTDLTIKEWVQHAQEEAMDLAVYLEKIKAVINEN